jgi:transcriptional regulator with XRE-family HTH domain
MKFTSPIPLPVNRSLARLGDAVSRARRRRQFTQQDLASRIGASITTVQRMEAGHPGTAIVHIARALQVFGELDKLDQILDLAHDPIGLALSDQQLPQRVRPPRKRTDSMRNTQTKDGG